MFKKLFYFKFLLVNKMTHSIKYAIFKKNQYTALLLRKIQNKTSIIA